MESAKTNRIRDYIGFELVIYPHLKLVFIQMFFAYALKLISQDHVFIRCTSLQEYHQESLHMYKYTSL